MRKRIICIIAAILILLTIVGCGVSEDGYDVGRMRMAEKHALYSIWIDTDTGVCYLHDADGGFVVMVDHTGMPYIANGWRDWSDGDELY